MLSLILPFQVTTQKHHIEHFEYTLVFHDLPESRISSLYTALSERKMGV